MAQRGDHFKADNGESYCYDTDGYDVHAHGDEIVNGPQPDNFCRSCRNTDLDWQEVTLEEFNRMFA